MKNSDLNLITLSNLFVDEDAARAFIESKLWPDGPVCPHCGLMDAYKLTAKPESKKPVRKGVYKCKGCRKQFTVRVGTIFEDSHIPFSKWIMTLHLMTSSKKGVSALQISREVGVTIKSAWFLCHRIREAMRGIHDGSPLTGMVEVDEAYVGGKPRPSGKPLPPMPPLGKRDSKFRGRRPGITGRGTKKAPVMVLVERDGNARCTPVKRVTAKELGSQIETTIAKDAILMTDEFNAYTDIGRRHPGGHETINHVRKQYVRTREDGLKVHTNTAESFFALLKRGHYGVFHSMSKKHLHRYCDEFEFRWNHRKVSDGERMVAAVLGAEGKRLKYA